MLRPKGLHSVTCGCCSNGCVCHNHKDIPKGIKPAVCEYHASLPYHPIDRIYRYDAQISEYVRIPQGE
jgi:hypothetical protein